MSYRPDMLAPWERLANKIQVSGKHGHLISGKSLLPQFAYENEIAVTQDEDLIWDDVISPFFDLHSLPSIFQANSGFHANSPFPCPQTLIIINPYTWKARMNTGQGLFIVFYVNLLETGT